MLPDVRQYFWLEIFGKRILAMATLPPLLPIYFLTKRHRAKTKLRKTECLYSWEPSVIYFCPFHKCIISLVFLQHCIFTFKIEKKVTAQGHEKTQVFPNSHYMKRVWMRSKYTLKKLISSKFSEHKVSKITFILVLIILMHVLCTNVCTLRTM